MPCRCTGPWALYGLLNNHWALILAMVTIASPYAIWVLKQASDKLPVELDEAAMMDGASPLQLFRLVYLPLMMPSLVAIGTYALLLAWNEYLYAFLLLSRDTDITLPVGARQLPRRRRFAVGAADDHGPDLCAAAGGDLLHLQALHGRRAHGRRGEELRPSERVAGVTMKTIYDERNDTLFVRFTETAIIESEEISPGLILDYDVDGRIVALEFLNASKKIAGEATLKELAA